jgi:hypothetical protein
LAGLGLGVPCPNKPGWKEAKVLAKSCAVFGGMDGPFANRVEVRRDVCCNLNSTNGAVIYFCMDQYNVQPDKRPPPTGAVRRIVEALKTSKKEADEDRQDGTSVPNDQPVFASRYEGVSALARNSLSKAVQGIVADNNLTKFTPHDLRRTGATLAQSVRIPTDFVKGAVEPQRQGRDRHLCALADVS